MLGKYKIPTESYFQSRTVKIGINSLAVIFLQKNIVKSMGFCMLVVIQYFYLYPYSYSVSWTFKCVGFTAPVLILKIILSKIIFEFYFSALLVVWDIWIRQLHFTTLNLIIYCNFFKYLKTEQRRHIYIFSKVLKILGIDQCSTIQMKR